MRLARTRNRGRRAAIVAAAFVVGAAAAGCSQSNRASDGQHRSWLSWFGLEKEKTPRRTIHPTVPDYARQYRNAGFMDYGGDTQGARDFERAMKDLEKEHDRAARALD